MGREDEPETLLSLLEKQGQEFLTQFPAFYSHGSRPDNGPELKPEIKNRSTDTVTDSEEEWMGFSDTESSPTVIPELLEKDPEVLTFSDTVPKATPVQYKESFMSSKISKLKELRHEAKLVEGDQSEEESNIRNDALLHRLIHTELFTESLKSETVAKRRKALAGRILELRGDAKIGKGEVLVREKERNLASKSVREGILSKKNQRLEKALAEAKESGNYHSSLRKLYEVESNINRRKRERGLSMGVGRFKGGVLKLSKLELKSAEGFMSASNSRKRAFKKNI